jgi:hypothetical protein
MVGEMGVCMELILCQKIRDLWTGRGTGVDENIRDFRRA